jgi:hypothetical protein
MQFQQAIDMINQAKNATAKAKGKELNTNVLV